MLLRFIQHTTWVICNLIWRLFFKLEVSGQENIMKLKDGMVIFAGSHQGYVDSFILGSSIPTAFWQVSQGLKLLTYYKFIDERWYGSVIRQIGAYPVYPGRGKMAEVLKDTVEYLNSGFSIVMFPNGKIHSEIKSEDAKPGVAYLMRETGAQVVPVLINNTNNLKCDLFRCRRQIQVVFGEPCRYSDLAEQEDDLVAVARKVMERVVKLN